jgi:hypothetical protein
MPTWDDFPDAQQDEAAGEFNSWDAFPDDGPPKQAKKPRPEHYTGSTGDMAADAATGFGYGFNTGFDALANLVAAPIREPINYAARQFGYEGDLIPELEAARRFNVAGVPDTTSGRMGEAVGEVTGGSALPVAGMYGTAAKMGQSAPGILRQFATQPGKVGGLEATANVGAGVGVGTAREAETGPVGELAAGLAGGFIAPSAANITARRVAGAKAGMDYAGEAVRRARDPEAAAYENVAGRLSDAGVDTSDIRAAMAPQPSAALARRGFTEEDTAEMVSRVLRGEHVDDVAPQFGIHPDTLRRYIRGFAEENPTPRNVVDVAKEVGGEGRAQPIARLGRSSYSIADDASADAAERLLSRQEEQSGRASAIVSRSVGDADFDATLTSGRQQLADEARRNYDQFYSEPALATREIGDLMEDPVFRRAMRTARQQARVEAIRHNQQVRRTGQGEMQPVMPVDEPTDVYTPQMLDYIQRQLRIMGEGHLSDPNKARQAQNLREVFLDRIEDHYPSFRDIRRNYATRMGEFGADGALEAGRGLVARLGERTSDALREFDTMTPAQQELFRIGFAEKLRMEMANPQYGHQVVAKFNTPAFRQMISRLYRGDRDLSQRGQRLLRDLRREATTTRTKNEIMSGSRTAELQSDMADQMQMAKSASDALTGRFGQLLENLSNRIAKQIGKRGAEEVLKILTSTDPAEVLPILNRLARTARSQAERKAYRDAIRQWRQVQYPNRPGTAAGAVASTTAERER